MITGRNVITFPFSNINAAAPFTQSNMGDFQANFLRPDTGINTVEGNVAGSRAAGLSKKRAAEQVRRYMHNYKYLSFMI